MANALDVINGLECCISGHCSNCPYSNAEGRQRIGCTLDRNHDALELLKSLSAFKDYFDKLYGDGLQVANWHMNGELEPFDSFYESAVEAMGCDE